MRVGERFGVVVLAARDGAARYLIQGGIGYLCLDLRADLVDCVDPTLRQLWRWRCRGFRRRLRQTPPDSPGLAEPEWDLGRFARGWW
jgi:hypothetical protein